jgi:predicted nucleic acid-binding protein
VAVIDASALIAIFAGEPASAQVEQILKTANARVSVINLGEVYDHFMRVRKTSRRAIDERVNALRHARAFALLPVDEQLATRAGELRATHYHRVRRPVSQADCVALATAEALNDSLATTDPDLAAMARDENVELIALPDSSGRRP